MSIRTMRLLAAVFFTIAATIEAVTAISNRDALTAVAAILFALAAMMNWMLFVRSNPRS